MSVLDNIVLLLLSQTRVRQHQTLVCLCVCLAQTNAIWNEATVAMRWHNHTCAVCYDRTHIQADANLPSNDRYSQALAVCLASNRNAYTLLSASYLCTDFLEMDWSLFLTMKLGNPGGNFMILPSIRGMPTYKYNRVNILYIILQVTSCHIAC